MNFMLPGGEHRYRMETLPRGLCVIINNRDFKKDKGKSTARKLEPREGTDKDRDALKTTFEELLFEVRLHENLTDKQMVKTLSQVGEEDHSEYDCFVCCLLTYGEPGLVLGVNGSSVKIRSLTNAVKTKNCASLEGKPKLFFVQACPTTAPPAAGDMSDDDAGKEEATAAAAAGGGGGAGGGAGKDDGLSDSSGGGDKDTKLLPNETDYMVAICFKAGFLSAKAKENGSLYVQKLVKFLKKYGNSHDILEIVGKVNDAINDLGGGPGQDLAISKDTLRMKLRVAPSPKVENVRLMVIGKSKRGKSSTANTILGQDLFSVNNSFEQNLTISWHTATRQGRSIEITEMPTELESEDAARPLITTTPGPHVILLCFRCEQFFTPDDYFAYSTIKRWLGKHFSKYVILVFSGLDNTTGKGVEDVLRNSFISILRELPSPERLICLNNKADRETRKKQGEKLLRLVDRVIQENGGGHFSNRKIRQFEEEVTYQQSHGKSREDVKRRVVAGDELDQVFRKQCCPLM
ncbi:uncharacterized protein LOC143291906 [Babylonia areolata]|uniref:uncharacterized protein LOC143291906 n=1 Tax=Babylonia areolata TaxID=304850 RepID=UPI003FD26B2D